MLCRACGTENPTGSRFCDQCGATLASACPSCGAGTRPDARFCGICGTPLTAESASAQPAVKAEGAERRLVSVLFADLVGFTSLVQDRDPEAVRELLSGYFAVATRVVTLHGGTVEKFIGDAVMAVWGTPMAHEDDAERAVRAAIELMDAVQGLHPGLEARAGVLSGDAAVTVGATNEGMVAGDLVNTAARLQAAADPGSVLVGEATMRAASGAVIFEPLGEQSLKGKTSPVPVWRAVRVVAARGGQGRADELEPPFVGREEELRELKDVLHAVGRDRRPRLVSITGPAGIGKSRLAWELEKYVDGVAEPVHWHRGRSPSYGEGITFWALGEMVRRRAQLTEDDDERTTRQHVADTLEQYIPEASERDRIGPAILSLLGVEPAPPGGRDALFPAWRAFFERLAEHGTTVLVFEDLQWADSGLLDFIDHLLEWTRGLPILVVTLARPELFDRRPGWGSGRRHLTGMALDPLTDAHMRKLLEGLVPGLPPRAVAAVVERAEGIPLYAVETVRGLLADGLVEARGDGYVPTGDLAQLRAPDSLRSLIASRLDALSAADRSLLQDAAVLGQVFTADALAATTGLPRDELDPRLRDLVRRELLGVERDPASPEIGQYKFVQSLIREVAYGTLGRRERRERHLAVARHYESVGDEEVAGALASHYLAAHEASDPGPEADALATQARLALQAAADRAASLGAHAQAVRHLEQAIAITGDRRDRAELLDRAVVSAVASASGQPEEHARAAVEAYRELGDGRGEARASAALGQALINTGSITEAIDVLEAALEAATSLDDPEAEAHVLANLSRAYMRHLDDEKAVGAADRALQIAEPLELEELVAEALLYRGTSLSRVGQRRQGVALLEAVVAMSRSSGRTNRELRARNNLATLLAGEDPARATTIVWEAADLARRIGDRSQFNWLASSVGLGALYLGERWDEAMRLVAEALEDAELPSDRGRLSVALGLLEIAQGEPARILREVDELPAEPTAPDAIVMVSFVRSMAALASGDLDEAFRQGIAAAEQPGQMVEFVLLIAMHAAAWQRDADRHRSALEPFARLSFPGPIIRAIDRRGTAIAAAIEGRREEAAPAFADVRGVLRGFDQRFEYALTAIDAMSVLPDEPEIRQWAGEARDMLAAQRAKPFVDRLDAALDEGTSAVSGGR